MKLFFSLLILHAPFSLAASFSPQEASMRIEQAVAAVEPLALSGVKKFRVKPARTVKEMMFELAVSKGRATDSSDFSWVESATDAWETDSGNWGETDMNDAFAYIMDSENVPENVRANYEKDLAKAKEGFK